MGCDRAGQAKAPALLRARNRRRRDFFSISPASFLLHDPVPIRRRLSGKKPGPLPGKDSVKYNRMFPHLFRGSPFFSSPILCRIKFVSIRPDSFYCMILCRDMTRPPYISVHIRTPPYISARNLVNGLRRSFRSRRIYRITHFQYLVNYYVYAFRQRYFPQRFPLRK